MSSTSVTGGIFVTGFATALFGIIALIHICVLYNLKVWFFQLMSLGAVMQFVGFVVQAAAITAATGSYYDESRTMYFVPAFLFTFAQTIITVSCYTVLSRIIWFAAPSQQRTSGNCFLPPNHITTLVSLYETVTVAVTIAGSALMINAVVELVVHANETDTLTSGYSVVMVGLVLQLCSRIYLQVVVWRVTTISKSWIAKSTGLRYDTRTMLHVVNLSGMMLTVRALYQLIAVGAKVVPEAWMFYVFDAAPLLVVLVLFAGIHPGQVLPPRFIELRLNTRSLIAQEWHPSGDMAIIAPVQRHEQTSSQEQVNEANAQEARTLNA